MGFLLAYQLLLDVGMIDLRWKMRGKGAIGTMIIDRKADDMAENEGCSTASFSEILYG